MFHHQLFRVLAFLFCLIGCALCVLGMIAQQPPGDAVRYPISGSGGGGAYGPSILHSFSDLPSPSAEDKAMAAQRALLIESLAEKQAGVLSRANQAVIPPWSRQVQSNDSEFIESGDSATPSNAAAPTVSNGFSETTVVMKIANGTSTALRISKNAAGSGPLASEIGVPLGGTSTINEALIAYDYSDSAFYPGIKMAIWNVDNNSIISRSVLKAGILTPNNGDQNRWTDFMDALSPIPGKGSFVVGGTVARPTPNDDQQRATFWGTVTP